MQLDCCWHPCVLRPLARGAVDGSSGKLGRRRDVRALVRRSRHTAALGEPAAPRLCVPQKAPHSSAGLAAARPALPYSRDTRLGSA
jgi:hypothetical protein